jgi:hypothetical protein
MAGHSKNSKTTEIWIDSAKDVNHSYLINGTPYTYRRWEGSKCQRPSVAVRLHFSSPSCTSSSRTQDIQIPDSIYDPQDKVKTAMLTRKVGLLSEKSVPILSELSMVLTINALLEPLMREPLEKVPLQQGPLVQQPWVQLCRLRYPANLDPMNP